MRRNSIIEIVNILSKLNARVKIEDDRDGHPSTPILQLIHYLHVVMPMIRHSEEYVPITEVQALLQKIELFISAKNPIAYHYIVSQAAIFLMTLMQLLQTRAHGSYASILELCEKTLLQLLPADIFSNVEFCNVFHAVSTPDTKKLFYDLTHGVIPKKPESDWDQDHYILQKLNKYPFKNDTFLNYLDYPAYTVPDSFETIIEEMVSHSSSHEAIVYYEAILRRYHQTPNKAEYARLFLQALKSRYEEEQHKDFNTTYSKSCTDFPNIDFLAKIYVEFIRDLPVDQLLNILKEVEFPAEKFFIKKDDWKNIEREWNLIYFLFYDEPENYTTFIYNHDRTEHKMQLVETAASCLSALGENIAKQSKALTSNSAPILIQANPLFTDKIRNALNDFYQAAHETNNQAVEYYQHDLLHLTITYYPIIIQIINITGETGISFLRSKIENTILNFRQLLKATPLLSSDLQSELKYFFEKKWEKTSEKMINFVECFNAIDDCLKNKIYDNRILNLSDDPDALLKSLCQLKIQYVLSQIFDATHKESLSSSLNLHLSFKKDIIQTISLEGIIQDIQTYDSSQVGHIIFTDHLTRKSEFFHGLDLIWLGDIHSLTDKLKEEAKKTALAANNNNNSLSKNTAVNQDSIENEREILSDLSKNSLINAGEHTECQAAWSYIKMLNEIIRITIKKTVPKRKNKSNFDLNLIKLKWLIQENTKGDKISSAKIQLCKTLLSNISLFNRIEKNICSMLFPTLKDLYSFAYRINNAAAPHHQCDLLTITIEYNSILNQLIDIMGDKSSIFLKSKINNTVLRLVDVLTTTPLIPEDNKSFFQLHFNKPWLKKLDELEYFVDCINAFEFCQENKIEINIGICKKLDDPKSLLAYLCTLSLKNLLQRLSITIVDSQAVSLIQNYDVSDTCQLILASNRMQNDESCNIYLHLIWLDLSGGDIYSFFHNKNQESPLGKILAIHNEKIQQQLSENKIKAWTALNYMRQYHFVYSPDSQKTSDIYFGWTRQWSYLIELRKKIMPLLEKNILNEFKKIQEQMLSIQKKINALEKNIGSDQTQLNIYNTLIENKASLDNIALIIKNLKKIYSENKLLSSFFEFSEYFVEQNDNLKKTDAPLKIKASQAPKYFTVKQWDKTDSKTFFLGNAVGCCIATDSIYFQAMVQRRMDDAMLFHVAIDNSTGKPAALIWLYLAKQQEGAAVVLVANFFEVNTGYAENTDLRKSLLNALLEFTRQYCADHPYIKAFYMNLLNHGANMGGLDDYPVQSVKLSNKLGGAFFPENNGTDNNNDSGNVNEKASKLYHLDSLSKNKFHQFDPEILQQHKLPQSISLAEIIAPTIKASLEKSTSFRSIKADIITKHQVLLAQFFTDPLDNNPQLDNFIRELIPNLSFGLFNNKAVSESNLNVSKLNKNLQ